MPSSGGHAPQRLAIRTPPASAPANGGSAAMIANLTSTFMIIPINCFVTMRILDDVSAAVGGPSLGERSAIADATSLSSGRVLQHLSALAMLARRQYRA